MGHGQAAHGGELEIFPAEQVAVDGPKQPPAQDRNEIERQRQQIYSDDEAGEFERINNNFPDRLVARRRQVRVVPRLDRARDIFQ